MSHLDTRLKLTLVAFAATAVTLAGVASYSSYSRRKRRAKLARDVKTALSQSDDNAPKLPRPELLSGHHSQLGDGLPQARQAEYSEDLIREQLVRNYAFFPDGGMDKIRAAKVVVVGCGGVGSWAAVMLARS